MDTGPVIGVVGLLLAGGGILAARRWGNRRNRLDVSIEYYLLLTKQGASRQKVTGDVVVTGVVDPYAVVIKVTNAGPSDVTPAAFGDEKGAVGSILLKGCTLGGSLPGEVHDAKGLLVSSVGGGGGYDRTRWDFQPIHIPRRCVLVFSGIVDGRPTGVELGRKVEGAERGPGRLYDVDVRYRSRRLRPN